jgi:hypothetical protein
MLKAHHSQKLPRQKLPSQRVPAQPLVSAVRGVAVGLRPTGAVAPLTGPDPNHTYPGPFSANVCDGLQINKRRVRLVVDTNYNTLCDNRQKRCPLFLTNTGF